MTVRPTARRTVRTEHTLGAFGGDYVPADDGRMLTLPRRLLLAAVARCTPEALRALAAIAPDLPDGLPSSGLKWDQEAPLREWQAQWGLTAPSRPSGPDWIRTAARNLAGAMRDGLWTEQLSWGVLATSYRPPTFQPMTNPTWNAIEEKEITFMARVKEYIASVKATPGIRPALTTRVEPGETIDRDYEWLALYQVARMSPRQIMERYRMTGDDSIVRKAVRSAARSTGLSLRVDRRGRPTKNRK